MKKNKIIYWTITGILIAGLLTSTIPSILMMDYAVDHFTNYLGYPKYFLLFTGITKMLGIIGLFCAEVSEDEGVDLRRLNI